MKLRQFLHLQNHSTNPQHNPEVLYNLYSLPAFDNGRSCEVVAGKHIQSNKFIVPDKCILFNKLNVRFKRIWVVDNQDSNKIASTEFLPLVVDESIVDFRYCYYLLCSDQITNYLVGQNTNTSGSHKRIDPKNFLDIEVELPSMVEQQTIGDVLATLDYKIALNSQINDNLEAMAKQLYDYWFVQFDFPDENGKPYKSSGGKMVWNEKLKREIPEGWHDVSLNELASPQRTIVKPQEEVLYQHFSIPSYDAGGSYELNYGHQIHSDKFLLREGQLLVSKLNPWFNRVLWVPEGKNMISSTEFVIMNPKQRSDSGYLYSIVKSKPFVDFCSQAATGTSHSQRRISPDVMLAFRFPYNPNVSERYGKTIEYIFSQQDCIKNLSRSLSKQRDEIIPLLLTGQVSVNYHLSDD